MRPTVSPHETRVLRDVRLQFAELFGARAFQRRQMAIAQLPMVTWRGRVLHTIRCQGDFGRGPHSINVPESLLWSLIDFNAFRCAYHR